MCPVFRFFSLLLELFEGLPNKKNFCRRIRILLFKIQMWLFTILGRFALRTIQPIFAWNTNLLVSISCRPILFFRPFCLRKLGLIEKEQIFQKSYSIWSHDFSFVFWSPFFVCGLPLSSKLDLKKLCAEIRRFGADEWPKRLSKLCMNLKNRWHYSKKRATWKR